MPPKSRQQKRGEAQNADAGLTPFARPSTPNDFKIVATVKALQELANTETKWKNRISEAQYADHVVKSKIARIHQLIALCDKGIASCTQDVEGLVQDQYNMVTLEPTQAAIWANEVKPAVASVNTPAAGSAAAAAKEAKTPKGGKGDKAVASMKGPEPVTGTPGSMPSAEADAALAGRLPESFWATRRAQRDAIRNIVMALYNIPRLARERQVQRPASALEMRHEVDEATRLSTPVAELLAASAVPRHTPGQKKAADKPPAAKKGAASGKGGKNASVVEDDTASLSESEAAWVLTGDLNPSDCLILPTPRGLDPRLMYKVQMLRSRRLRLESSIELFRAQLPQLEARLRCVVDMAQVGQYSLTAVQPQVARVVEEEVSLQRVRQQEDEAYAAKRGLTLPSMSSPNVASPSRGK